MAQSNKRNNAPGSREMIAEQTDLQANKQSQVACVSENLKH